MERETPSWVGWTYLLYCMTVIIVVIGGTGYAVFVLGHSGWWLLGAIVLSGFTFSPWRWHCIYTGKEVPFSSFGKDK